MILVGNLDKLKLHLFNIKYFFVLFFWKKIRYIYIAYKSYDNYNMHEHLRDYSQYLLQRC